jgi:hypothetical protein
VSQDDRVDDAIEAAVREVERDRAAAGWDRPPALYALARTADLVRDEPDLAERLGLAAETARALTPVAQEDLELDASIPDVLARIQWPDDVLGAVLVIETVVLPAHVEDQAPGSDAGSWAVQRPERQEARIVVGVLRDGRRAAALRWRSHDTESDVATGPDLAPALADALAQSLR